MSEEKNEKKSKTTKIIIVIVIILVILGIIAGGIFIYSKSNKTETEWGNYYYGELLKELKDEEQEISDYENSKNVKIKFIQAEEEKTPMMVVSYEKDNHNSICVYSAYETEDKKSKYSIVKSQYFENSEQNINYDIKLLYNLEEQKYIWYIVKTDENNGKTYTPIILDLKNKLNIDSNEKTYYFTEEEMKTNQIAEDGTPIVSKFEETFIVVEDTDNVIEIGDIYHINKNTLKEQIKLAEKEYKNIVDTITNEIKTTIENKVKELKDKKEQIKTILEEKAQKEAEELAKAQEEAKQKAEEARKKAEEEAKKKIEAKSNNTSTTSGNISEEQARKLAEKIDGTYDSDTGSQIGYTLEAKVKDSTGLEYYLFRVRWLVGGDHWSTIDGVAISVDGKKWKQIDIYQNYKNGQTIKEVYKEGNF